MARDVVKDRVKLAEKDLWLRWSLTCTLHWETLAEGLTLEYFVESFGI